MSFARSATAAFQAGHGAATPTSCLRLTRTRAVQRCLSRSSSAAFSSKSEAGQNARASTSTMAPVLTIGAAATTLALYTYFYANSGGSASDRSLHCDAAEGGAATSKGKNYAYKYQASYNSETGWSTSSSSSSPASEARHSVPDISHLNLDDINDPSKSMRIRMETYIKDLQHRIVTALGAEETHGRFIIDSWIRKEGGEGISCVLQDGKTFEKAGVNISVVHGKLPPAAVRQMSADHAGLMERTGYQLDGPNAEVDGLPFYAAGLSLVVHPANPFAPTVHFNYRYFEITHPPTLKDGRPNPRYVEAQKKGESAEPVAWWFGGGTDLTPIYLFEEDAKHFHRTLKEAADKNDTAFYPAWKKWCDDYFLIPHRKERRGIGGIFFDDLTLPDSTASLSSASSVARRTSYIPLSDGKKGAAATARGPLTSSQAHSKESLFRTVRSMGDAFLPAYLPLLQRRKWMAYTDAHERWQALRRGRYVEFNLVYDRGTKFGLQTPGARIESILMSLPLKARWEYMEKFGGAGWAELGQDEARSSREAATQKVLREPRDWI
ncbi:Coproporphyrinogen-III oxidase [Tilletia horrida]|uniref:coproporphyrinogen oxidase n=1 Tax=Tilletia horrida TaxID=155126 RepID=A0AAN6GQF0_9BASI|nr:Coproporphyrinogen-III oxidase [Tilletia horrida]KAK0566018.1 Coproporphyrinogen-III oxidase [Tilletia horrida]